MPVGGGRRRSFKAAAAGAVGRLLGDLPPLRAAQHLLPLLHPHHVAPEQPLASPPDAGALCPEEVRALGGRHRGALLQGTGEPWERDDDGGSHDPPNQNANERKEVGGDPRDWPHGRACEIPGDTNWLGEALLGVPRMPKASQ